MSEEKIYDLDTAAVSVEFCRGPLPAAQIDCSLLSDAKPGTIVFVTSERLGWEKKPFYYLRDGFALEVLDWKGAVEIRSEERYRASSIAFAIADMDFHAFRPESYPELAKYIGRVILGEVKGPSEKNIVDRLREEIEALRLYGNKDCTALADEVLAKKRGEKK